MKFSDKKYITLALIPLIISGCSIYPPSNQSFYSQKNNLDSDGSITYGTVKFILNFPEKFTNAIKKTFGIKKLEASKINRVKITVNSATQEFKIQRTVDLVPGGIEATLSLPLDRLYTVTIEGLNDTEPVSGAVIKGYFSLASASETPTVNVNQFTTPVATIIEGVKDKLASNSSTITEESDNNTEAADEKTEPAKTEPAKTETKTEPSIAKSSKIIDIIDLKQLNDTINRARGASHPSLLNTSVFVDAIIKDQKTPSEVPENALLKPGRIVGTISGLKANEVAIVTVGDPASNQAIVVTPPVVKSGTAASNPDADAEEIEFLIDNVTPGEWPVSAVASGYTIDEGDSEENTITVAADSEATSDFEFIPSEWLELPINISGNIGNSDQPDADLDPADNIHLVWRQDGFTTDSDSGIIFYSRWNGTSWTTQNVNVSQYNYSQLRGSRNPAVATGLDRLPHIIWSAKNSSGSRGVYYNFFNGTTWNSPLLLPGSTDGINTDLAVDKTNGFLYAVWENAGNILLSRYDRQNWSNPMTLGAGNRPKVVSGTDGMIHIVWKDNNYQKIKYTGFNSKDQSKITEDIPFGLLGSDSDNQLNLTVDRFNRVHVIWRNSGNIQYALKSNTSWSQPEVVNQISNQLLEATTGGSITVAPTGIINVAWTSKVANDKEVIRFRRRLNSGWKKPFQEITDLNNTGSTVTSPTKELTENAIGYENIPLSHVNKVENYPIIIADGAGNIHIIWSNRGDGVNDTDLLHSVKGTQSDSKK